MNITLTDKLNAEIIKAGYYYDQEYHLYKEYEKYSKCLESKIIRIDDFIKKFLSDQGAHNIKIFIANWFTDYKILFVDWIDEDKNYSQKWLLEY